MRTVLIAVVLLATGGCTSSGGGDPATTNVETLTSVVTVTSDAMTQSTAADSRDVSGVVVLNGATMGCGGEQVTVQVRDDTGVVAGQLVDSSLEGVDCVFRFGMSVPLLKCYELVVDRQPVGLYPASALDDSGYVGIIDSKSVYGDPSKPHSRPRLYDDYNGACLGD